MKLLILSVGRDIVSGAERQLGLKADLVIQSEEIGPPDFPGLRKKIYQQLKEWQGETIRLVLSGPLALSFTLGQLVGLNHFQVSVMHYQAETGSYLETPVPDRKEIQ